MTRRDFHQRLIGTAAIQLLGRTRVTALARTPTVIPLKQEHLPEAARLLTKQHLAARQREPALPSVGDIATRLAAIQVERGLPPTVETDGLSPLLRNPRNPAVAAFKDGALVGYLRTAGRDQLTTSIRAAYTGMQDLAVDVIEGAETYRHLYAAIAQEWLAQGCSVHFVKIFATDQQAIETWFSLGFGQREVQAFRDTNYTSANLTGTDIVPAGAEHVDLLMQLQSEDRRYESGTPMFLPAEPAAANSIEARRQEIRTMLRDPDRRCWVAFQNGKPVAMMSLRPAAGSGLSPLLQMTRMTYVEDALTSEGARDSTVRAALLDTALNWARRQGYERCYAGFHAADTPARQFWFGAGFEPVSYWLMRRLVA